MVCREPDGIGKVTLGFLMGRVNLLLLPGDSGDRAAGCIGSVDGQVGLEAVSRQGTLVGSRVPGLSCFLLNIARFSNAGRYVFIAALPSVLLFSPWFRLPWESDYPVVKTPE
jgi:hypothetical protein